MVRRTNGNPLDHAQWGQDLYANISHIADKVMRSVGRELTKMCEARSAR